MKRIWLCLLSVLLLLGCQPASDNTGKVEEQFQQTYQWHLVTSWPKNFPGFGTIPEAFAEKVRVMSGGRLTIQVHGGGDLVPAFDVFDAVSRGTAQMGHSASFYWRDRMPAAQFFTSIPFGMNAQEMNGWLNYGGGMALWREVYAPFGVIPFVGGNTGVQMGGWFNKEINDIDDLKGLKMRMPGLGGQVLARLGGMPVTLPAREIFTALDTGIIDATEWVGPYNDLAFKLHKVAKFYYYPGWHEPGTTLEFLVNQAAYDALPNDLKAIVEVAAQAVNQQVLDEFTTRNISALDSLVNEHQVELRRWPNDVLERIQKTSVSVLEDEIAKDPLMAKINQHYQAYLAGVRRYHAVSEDAYNDIRQ